MRIFIIGPGGVGKSSSGKILSELISYEFIDLDQEFCNHIGIVGDFIGEFWYEKYCFENSKLFYDILGRGHKDFVFSLSSGFLVHKNLEILTEKHKKTLNDEWLTILLLPSKSIEDSTDIVVERQLWRWFGLNEKAERAKFIERYPIYEKLWDIQIFSHKKPEIIAAQMQKEILSYEKNIHDNGGWVSQ